MTEAVPYVEVRDVSRRFGGIQALSGVSVKFWPGEVHALCGANGAGKSTLKNVVAGSVAPDSGCVLVEGEEVSFRTPLDSLRVGIHAVHQELGLIPWMSVEDNLFLARYPQRGPGVIDRRALRRGAQAALDSVGVPVSPRARVGALSVGQQQLVEIARSTAAEPRCLLLDEPSAVLVGPELERVFEAVESLRKAGVAIVYVSHRLDEVFRLADRVTVMRNGQVVETAETSHFDHDSLIRAMTGEASPRPLSTLSPPRQETRLSVRGVSAGRGRLADLSLDVYAGELVGIAGLMGSGRSHLMKVLFGIDQRDGGSVLVDGKPLGAGTPGGATSAGVAFVPEDRKMAGLVLDMSIKQNLTLPNLGRVARRGWIDVKAQVALATRLAQLVGLAPNRLPAPVSQLSGGNQQKVALSRWLHEDPAVLLIDEPTRGVDVGAKADIYNLLRGIANRGSAVLVVSSEFEELIAMCHRILVMKEGRLVAEVDAERSSPEELLRLSSPVDGETADV